MKFKNNKEVIEMKVDITKVANAILYMLNKKQVTGDIKRQT